LLETLRKIVRPFSISSAAAAAITYAICTFLPDENHWLKALWRLSATAGLLAYGLELICRRFDAKEFRDLRYELSEARKVADEAHRRTARRQITESGKAKLKEVLARYPRQPFEVVVLKGSEESREFATQIQAVFQDFGWVGNILVGDSPKPQMVGIGMASEPITDQVTQAIREVNDALKSDGIALAQNWHRISEMPIRAGMIEINVGRKPIP
jgi:hypothetical protein